MLSNLKDELKTNSYKEMLAPMLTPNNLAHLGPRLKALKPLKFEFADQRSRGRDDARGLPFAIALGENEIFLNPTSKKKKNKIKEARNNNDDSENYSAQQITAVYAY